ncbi:MAG TPA: TIGR02281 family clan AA aspartic protease [Rhizomicrobium sp.]|nr:TIGR02281 family clan AA aspartic protease [Rhizomicrobium sp.]
MPQTDGPWGRKPNPVTTGDQRRFYFWIAVAIVGALVLWKLSTLFPGALATDWDKFRLINLIGFLILLSAGIVMGRRFRTRDTLRNLAIWCAAFAVLGIGYTFRNELSAIGERVRGELIPSYAVATGPHEMTLTAGEDGGFYVDGEVNGAPAHFMIDTGATDIVLSPADAQRAGIDIAALDYSRPSQTANGAGWGAPAHVARLVVGGIELDDVPVTVNKAPMDSSLLGQAFLRRLDSFEARNGRLTLRWHS